MAVPAHITACSENMIILKTVIYKKTLTLSQAWRGNIKAPIPEGAVNMEHAESRELTHVFFYYGSYDHVKNAAIICLSPNRTDTCDSCRALS